MHILMLNLEFIDEREFVGGFCCVTVLLKGIFEFGKDPYTTRYLFRYRYSKINYWLSLQVT